MAGFSLLALACIGAHAQDKQAPANQPPDNQAPAPAMTGPLISMPTNDDNGSRMLVPPPVSGQSYPASFISEERSNYLRGGVTFSAAYSDNVLGGSSGGHLVSDISYSVWPTIALDKTTPRMHASVTYAPGFTFYQRTSGFNEADHNVALDFQYRLSPHVTLFARDGFQKSSNVFNQPNLGVAGVVAGGTAEPNQSVIAPLADRLTNAGNVGLSYQFAGNKLVGASGSFSNLHYPNPTQVPGLSDGETEGGSAFYSLRIARTHYVGAIYQYQRLLSFPAPGSNETQTHAALLFATFYLRPTFSISAFAGPQYASSGLQFSSLSASVIPASNVWQPEAGASLSWQGHVSNVAISYTHGIAGGGGLIGAVKTDAGSILLRQQLRAKLNASVTAVYAQNDLLAAYPVPQGNGHSLSATAAVQQQFGEHWGVQLGYTRLHQDYSSVAVLASNPDTNREFISISYQFSRPLGR